MNTDLLSFLPGELKELILARGDAGYRADQIFDWLHAKGASSYEEMGNVPKKLRQALSEIYPVGALTVYRRLVSADGTIKYLCNAGMVR